VGDNPDQSDVKADDAAAIALGLAGASRDKADAFLERQLRLTELQTARLIAEDDHIEEQQRLELSHLRFRRFGDYAKAAMESAVAILIAALLIGFLAMAWQASTAHGLVIEPIRTPPDLVQQGRDGNVLAQQVIDDLNGLVAKSDAFSYRAADSIGGNWGDDSKVAIPETGVSIGELNRSLRRWLGHETRLGGEVFHTANGITVELRIDGNPPVRVSGRTADLDELIATASETVFAQTQPFRYQMYLWAVDRQSESLMLARKMALTGPESERPWAYASWSNALMKMGAYREAVARAQQSLALDGDNPQALNTIFIAEWALGHLEDALAAGNRILKMLGHRADLAPLMLKESQVSYVQGGEELLGAWHDSIGHDEIMAQYTMLDFDQTIPPLIAMDYAQIYDVKAARAIMKGLPQWDDKKTTAAFAIMAAELPQFTTYAADEDWAGATRDLAGVDAYTLPLGTVNDIRHSLIWPWLAYSEARAGNLQAGQRLVALTPLDCNLCLRMRGRIAELAGNRPLAAGWYAKANTDAPSYPFALTDWGAMLLHHGDPADAIAKFREANRRVPRFADALELWGEALIADNRSDLAAAKFAEAALYAPKWGRLHLQWGEALLWLGRRDDARAQFDLAAALELTPSDRAILVRLRR
jgi:tetratricopeptide (TPR) repeat protein